MKFLQFESICSESARVTLNVLYVASQLVGSLQCHPQLNGQMKPGTR